MEESQPLSANVYSLIHELLVPLKTILGAHAILAGKVPEIIEEPLGHIGQISNKLHTEIMALFRDPATRINMQTADIAAEQIRLLAIEWEKDVKKLSQLISQISASNIHMEDESLSRILNRVLSNGLEEFRKYVTELKTIQSMDLELGHQ